MVLAQFRKTRPEVFRTMPEISQEYPRFRLRPYNFIGFGCVGYICMCVYHP